MDFPAPSRMETVLSTIPLLTIAVLISTVAVKFKNGKTRRTDDAISQFPETEARTDEHGAVVVPQWRLDIDAVRAIDTGEKGRRAAAEHRDLHLFLDVEYDRDTELDCSEHCLSPREVSQIWARQEAARWDSRWRDPHPNEVWKARHLAERFPGRYHHYYYSGRKGSVESSSDISSWWATGYSTSTSSSSSSAATSHVAAGYRLFLAQTPSTGVWVSTLQRRRRYKAVSLREPPRKKVRGLSLMEPPKMIPKHTFVFGTTFPKIWKAVREIWDLTYRWS